jgi:hypothetical protein
LVSSTSVNDSSLISASSWSLVMPALATITSTGPCSCSTAVKAASTDAASRTSQPTTDSPSTGSPDLEVTVTLSPSAASRRAIASPIPRFPPVTSTERPTCAHHPQARSTRQPRVPPPGRDMLLTLPCPVPGAQLRLGTKCPARPL